MQYILTAGWEDGIAHLARRLAQELSGGKRVLWLVSGGSNIPATIQVMHAIAPELSRRLTILPADERFGPVGHEGSNWQQLLNAGFDPDGATALPVLQAGLDEDQTLARYNELVAKTFADNDVIIGQMGIGPDGHIVGIMVDTPAVTDAAELVVKIPAEPYVRLTLSFAALRRIQAAYAFAFGAPKHETLLRLRDQTVPLDRQPAQILKELPEAYVYNDQLGETGE